MNEGKNDQFKYSLGDYALFLYVLIAKNKDVIRNIKPRIHPKIGEYLKWGLKAIPPA
jgi:hypothetical protein